MLLKCFSWIDDVFLAVVAALMVVLAIEIRIGQQVDLLLRLYWSIWNLFVDEGSAF